MLKISKSPKTPASYRAEFEHPLWSDSTISVYMGVVVALELVVPTEERA
jgi:hypothetical protein